MENSPGIDFKEPLDDRPASLHQSDDPALLKRPPPILFSSPSAFACSVKHRLGSVFTKRFCLVLLGGQVVSLCITCTNVTTTELTNRNWALSTTQSVFLYFSLFMIYAPYTMYQYGLKGYGQMLLRDGWKYLILAACDVEGNFLVVKAYQYTNLLSCMMLAAWSTPVCMFFTWVYLRTRYHWTQLLGVCIAIGGLGLLVASDVITDKDWQAADKGKGDAFIIAGATLYGFTNATEEFFVRRRPLYEVVGAMGLFGFIICGAQAGGLEHQGMLEATWNGATALLFLTCCPAMFILYTVAPLLYRAASSTYYNISLLTADFYGLLFAHYTPYWLYFIAFITVILGLVIYFWHSRPEEQGDIVPAAPGYVRRRGAHTDEENVVI
ncbi:hypothetical protein BD626DRAFT_488292 [Schizophyllum amplum]|uniref:DUF914-domain-containing protein n=1 Tax=Schizophyllum amplum TaxID=97359 RepID=A0A550CKI6_9AGAR|nr:hypothetical protein BD626DRAFT_488292 [Auriculariopsis ampla]